MLGAALAVIPTMIIQTSTEQTAWLRVASVADWVIWAMFVTEAVVMLSVVPDKGRWLRGHPLEVVIILFTVPFLPASFGSLRVARLLRLVRVLRIVRVAGSMRRLFTLGGLQWAGVLGLLVLVGGGTLFAQVESEKNLTAWDGIWWAFTTATTVGYGDLYPSSTAGRFIAVAVMGMGIGVIALVTGAIAERFVKPDAEFVAHEMDVDEEHILSELSDIGRRIQELERLIQVRRS